MESEEKKYEFTIYIDAMFAINVLFNYSKKKHVIPTENLNATSGANENNVDDQENGQ